MFQVRVNNIGQLRAICTVYEGLGYTNLMSYTELETACSYPWIVIGDISLNFYSLAQKDIRIVQFWEVFKPQLTPVCELKPGQYFKCNSNSEVFLCGLLHGKKYGISQNGNMTIVDSDVLVVPIEAF